MENVIELKGSNRRIGIDWSSGKDKSVLQVMKRDSGGVFTLEETWVITRQLNQREVGRLPDGTPVLILWSGGNGPHRYEVAQRRGGTWVYDNIPRSDGKRHVNLEAGMVDFVGREPPHTLVWELEDS